MEKPSLPGHNRLDSSFYSSHNPKQNLESGTAILDTLYQSHALLVPSPETFEIFLVQDLLDHSFFYWFGQLLINLPASNLSQSSLGCLWTPTACQQPACQAQVIGPVISPREEQREQATEGVSIAYSDYVLVDSRVMCFSHRLLHSHSSKCRTYRNQFSVPLIYSSA